MSFEIALELKKGTKTYFDVFVSNVSDSREGGSIALRLHDITAKKKREEELIDSNRQLDQVIYKTTHDLKAPLTSALGLINLAERAPAEEKDEYIALIRKSLLRLSGFIEEMNHFFRTEKLALMCERIDMRELIAEELENLKNLYHVGTLQIDVIVEGSEEFYSDTLRVKTVITNLLTNAIKYADSDKLNPWIRIHVDMKSDFCFIRIEDNGIGIEEEHKKKIFDLFYRATTRSNGTGIGLFIVKDTIARLKGFIDVASQAGIGTTFMIQIPNQVSH
jgi:signal transduction histidine kinase